MRHSSTRRLLFSESSIRLALVLAWLAAACQSSTGGTESGLKPDSDGDMKEQNNLYPNSTGTKTASGAGFTPPYTYAADGASGIAAMVMAGAGPR